MNLAPRGKRGSVVELIDAMGVAAVVVALFIFALAIVGGREDDRPAAPAAEPEAAAVELPPLPDGLSLVEPTERRVHLVRDRSGIRAEAYPDGAGGWVVARIVQATPAGEPAPDPAMPTSDTSRAATRADDETGLDIKPLAPALFERIERSHHIVLREGKRTLYAFYDSHCPGCREFSSDLPELLADHPDLGLVVIPVSVIGPPSLEAAGMLLAPEDSGTRRERLEALMANGPKALNWPLDEASAATGVGRAVENLSLLLDTEHAATPAFAFRGESGPGLVLGIDRESFPALVEAIAPGG